MKLLEKRERPQTLAGNYFYNFISQIMTQFAPLITTPYLTRVLCEQGNGQAAFANSLVTYFVYFAEFGFSTYGQREIAKCGDDKEARSRLFGELMILRIAFSAIALVTYFIMIFSPVIQPMYRPLLLINALQILGSATDIRFYYTGTENFKVIAKRTTIFRVVQLVLIFALIHSADQVWLYLLCFSASILIANIVLWPTIFRQIGWKQMRGAQPLKHLKPSFFVFLPVIAITIFNQIDSTMIGFLAKDADRENGCYFAAFSLISLLTVFVTVDTMVLASRNARDYKEGNFADLKRHLYFGFSYVWELAFPFSAALLVAAEHISRVYFGPGYDTTPAILRIFTIQIFAHGLFSLFANQYFIQTGREKMCTWVNFAGIGANIVLDLFLVRAYGGIGVAIASVLAESLMAVLFMIFFIKERRFFNIDVLRSAIKPAIAAAVAALPMYLIERTANYEVQSLILLLAIGAVIYLLMLFVLQDSFFLRYAPYLNPFRRRKGHGLS